MSAGVWLVLITECHWFLVASLPEFFNVRQRAGDAGSNWWGLALWDDRDVSKYTVETVQQELTDIASKQFSNKYSAADITKAFSLEAVRALGLLTVDCRHIVPSTPHAPFFQNYKPPLKKPSNLAMICEVLRRSRFTCRPGNWRVSTAVPLLPMRGKTSMLITPDPSAGAGADKIPTGKYWCRASCASTLGQYCCTQSYVCVGSRSERKCQEAMGETRQLSAH